MSLHTWWITLARWSGRVDPRLYAEGAVPSGAPPALARALRSARGRESQPYPFARIGDDRYPGSLLDLACPPAVVWFDGDVDVLRRPGLAVVGARACTSYGRQIACRLGAAAVGADGALISGAARGIDRAAHEGALPGPTVAVLGSGLGARPGGVPGRLQDRIANDGLLMTELPPSDPATRWTFPRRNRLIAALARCVVVVEAGRKSGALHTANAARDLDRPLLAVPGPIGAPASEGCLQLLSEGVAPLVRVEDAVTPLRPADSLASRLLTALENKPAPLSVILARAGAEPREALPLLSALELTGGVRRLPGGRYARP